MTQQSSIEVFIRVRPLQKALHETQIAWEFPSVTSIQEKANADTNFTFDKIYNTSSRTETLYEETVRRDIVARVVKGYNGTVFAYGQTGSGKSFTMLGDGRASGKVSGIVDMSIKDLFALLAQQQSAASPSSRAAPGKPSKSASPTTAASSRFDDDTEGVTESVEVAVSVLEIYNEQLRDLLLSTASSATQGGGGGGGSGSGGGHHSSSNQAPANTKLPLTIRESAQGVYVHNAIRRKVKNEEECLRVVHAGATSRISATTAMNEQSSRSHCIISLHIERTVRILDDDEVEEEDDEGFASDDTGTSSPRGGGGGRRGRTMTKKIMSVLHLVDLAGSERVAKTGATGVRMVEGGHINKSLTTLTNVINRLTEIHNNNNTNNHNGNYMIGGSGSGGAGAPNTFVPYRDSRLTHLLKTAIGGNSFTIIICCITPALESVNESRSTLQFASRAKCIKNKVVVNELADSKTQLRLLQLECHRLRRTMVAHTLYMWSKDIKIKKLREALMVAGVEGSAASAPPRAAGSSRYLDPSIFGGSGNGGGGGGAGAPSSVIEQQQIIIEQLTAERDALQEQVQTLTRRLANKDNNSNKASGNGKSRQQEEEEESHLLQEVRELHEMLEESESQRAQTHKSLQELDALCQEVEKENETNKQNVKQLTEKCRELEGLLEAVDEEGQATHQEMGLLRQQLQQTQQRLVQKGEGGDAYLAELTQLHVKHQELQYLYQTAEKKEQAELSKLQREVQSLEERLNDAEDEKEEVVDQNKLLHSYLWRLLSVTQMITQQQQQQQQSSSGGGGRAVAGAPPNLTDPNQADTAARGREVVAAVQALTHFAAQRGSGGGGGVNSGSRRGARGGGGSREELLERLRHAEAELVQKDAQRDIIIDAKLKRMQDLVLRLHTMNQSLVGEMQAVYQDNDMLFQLASKHASISSKMSKMGLAPRSLELALERARYARPPERPFGHN